jgi:hypothetical protein
MRDGATKRSAIPGVLGLNFQRTPSSGRSRRAALRQGGSRARTEREPQREDADRDRDS